MLYLQCIAKLAKAARTSLKQASEPSASHWLDDSYANFIKIESFPNFVLITNARGLYSILISQATEYFAMFGMIAGFNRWLTGKLMSLNVDAASISKVTKHHAHFAAYKTASRRVIGSMTEMVFHLRWMVKEQSEITVETLEDVLSEFPSKVIDYAFPLDKLEMLLFEQAADIGPLRKQELVEAAGRSLPSEGESRFTDIGTHQS